MKRKQETAMKPIAKLIRAGTSVLLVLALQACVSLNYPEGTAPVPGPPPPSAPSENTVGLPSGQLDLGDFRRAREQDILSRFTRETERRYVAGLAMSSALGDLRANQFTCAMPADRRGDAPAQECRREIREGECLHTWEVLLFQDGGRAAVSRTGAFYDRLCNTNSGLLGAPPR
jgi:hypothetical protein